MPTIEELEQRIADLESAMSDSSSPSFVTVGPDGSITFDFSGHIHATGLDLDLASTTLLNPAPDDNSIFWLPTGAMDPDLQEQLWATTIGGGVYLVSQPTDSSGASDLPTVIDGILAGEPQSSFLRKVDSILLGGYEDAISFGTNSVTGNGTATNTDTLTHQLGRTPSVAWAFPFDTALSSGGLGRLIATFETADNTNVTFRFRSNNDANWNNAISYHWVAIG